MARSPVLRIGAIALPAPDICGPSAATMAVVGNHLAGIGGGLRRVVLAGGRGAVVELFEIEGNSRHFVGLVGLLEGDHRTVGDTLGRGGVGAGEGQVDAHLHHLVGGERGADPGGRGCGQHHSPPESGTTRQHCGRTPPVSCCVRPGIGRVRSTMGCHEVYANELAVMCAPAAIPSVLPGAGRCVMAPVRRQQRKRPCPSL